MISIQLKPLGSTIDLSTKKQQLHIVGGATGEWFASRLFPNAKIDPVEHLHKHEKTGLYEGRNAKTYMGKSGAFRIFKIAGAPASAADVGYINYRD